MIYVIYVIKTWLIALSDTFIKILKITVQNYLRTFLIYKTLFQT